MISRNASPPSPRLSRSRWASISSVGTAFRSAIPCSHISRRNTGLTVVRRYSSPIRRRAKGSIDHGRLNAVDLDQGVEHRQRADPVRHRRGDLEPDRPADVVHDEVEAVEPERVDRRAREPAEPGPGVVEVLRAVGEPEAGEVERDPAQAAPRRARGARSGRGSDEPARRARRRPGRPSPCSRTKLRTPPASNSRPASRWRSITSALVATGGSYLCAPAHICLCNAYAMTANEGLLLGAAARAIGVSADTLRRWERQGRLRTVRDAANRRRVPPAEVERLAARPRPSPRRRRPVGAQPVRGRRPLGRGRRRDGAGRDRGRPAPGDRRRHARRGRGARAAPGVPATAAVKATSVMVSAAREAPRGAALLACSRWRRRGRLRRRRRRRGSRCPPPSSLTKAFDACSAAFDPEVRLSFGGSDELAAQIRQGVRPDVYAAANTKLPEELCAAGLLERPVRFAEERLVIAVPPPAPRSARSTTSPRRDARSWSAPRRCRSARTPRRARRLADAAGGR